MAALGLKTGTIVTWNEDERIEAGGGNIGVVPHGGSSSNCRKWHDR
jgi:hypothetical protein